PPGYRQPVPRGPGPAVSGHGSQKVGRPSHQSAASGRGSSRALLLEGVCRPLTRRPTRGETVVMAAIGKNFHIIHMGADYRELDAWYRDVFGVYRFMMDSRSEVLKRDASLSLIGDLCIEPMAPTFDLEG